MLAAGRAGRVGRARLDGQHVRPLGVPASGDFRLPVGDLVERPAQVHGGRAADRRVAPWHWAGQRPVELEDAGAVAVLGAAVARTRRGSRSPQTREQLAGRQVEQDDRSSRQVSEILDQVPGLGDAAMLG